MKKSICHYSYHRTWESEGWSCQTLASTVKAHGVPAVDFHVRFLGARDGAADAINAALESSGLAISGLSLSNNFNQEGKDSIEEQITAVSDWLTVAAEVNAPACRVFGGHIHDRSSREELDAGLAKVVYALERVAEVAEKVGVTLALENHGGLPCTGEEQVQIIDGIGSAALRATIDVGNYLQCGQDPVEGTRIAAPYASYIHFKDFAKDPAAANRFGLRATAVGEGDVDHAGCLAALAAAGYNGYVALEYEGEEDERSGVSKSVEFMNRVMAPYV